MNPLIINEPTEEPVEIDELRDHLKTDPADDELILSYLMAARRHVESVAGIALLTQTLEWAIDEFPCANRWNAWGSIALPRPPLQSITWIKYVDLNGTQQTLATDQYVANTRDIPGRADLAYAKWWPPIRYQPNAVTVRYVAGYTDPSAVPEELKQVLKVLTGALYENREEIVEGAAPQAVGLMNRLLAHHRVWVAA